MATQGITPDFQALTQLNQRHSADSRAHASTHFLTHLPNFLAEDVASHSEILVLETDGTYLPHRIVRLPLGVENHGYLLFPLDKNSTHVKAVFRGADKFEKHGNIMDSFELVEAHTMACLKEAIQTYSLQNTPLTLSLYGNSYERSSSQFFFRALQKAYTNSKNFDAIRCVHFNSLDSLKEQEEPSMVFKGTCTPINNKPIVCNFNHFSKISKNVIQQEAYDHIFKETNATLEQIAAKNAELPSTIREFAANQMHSKLSYKLAQKGMFHPKETYILTEEGTFQKYQIKQLPLVQGMYGYLLLPNDKNDRNVRVVFRGTDFSDLRSALINTEFYGPGSTSYPAVNSDVMAFIKVSLQTHFGQHVQGVKLNVTGHSQGASICQLFITAFLKERANTSDFDEFTDLTMTTFNDPGVHVSTQREADALVNKQAELGKPLTIKANFGYITGDVVQYSCQDMIFMRLLKDKVAITMMVIDNELSQKNLGQRHYLQNFLLTTEDTIDDSIPAMIQISNNNMTYSNENPEEHKTIQDHLSYKIKQTVNTALTVFHVLSGLYKVTSTCANMMPFSLQDYCYLAGGSQAYAGFEVAKLAIDAYCRSELNLEPRTVLNQFKNWVGSWAVKQTLTLGVSSKNILDEMQGPCLPKSP